MNLINDPNSSESEYAYHQGEPYLTTDIAGRYVILRDETIFSTSGKDTGIDQCYSSEVLVDPDPSDKDIFEYKLRGAVRENMFVAHRHSKDS